MTLTLLVDTETVGLPKSWQAPSTDFANWPRLVEIAWKIVPSDTFTTPTLYRVKPNGFTIPAEATRVHGITTEAAHATGRDLPDVLSSLAFDLQLCDTIVAHNARFDRKILEAEFLRCGQPVPWEGRKDSWKCSMLSTTRLCNIKGPRGPKWPRLEELYWHLFRERPPEGQHSAGVDVGMLERCYLELMKRRVVL